MTKRLTELKVGEVSLVDKAANKRKFLIMKSEEGGGTMGDLILKGVSDDLAKILKAIAEDGKYLDILKFAEGNEEFLGAVIAGDVELMKSILKGDEKIVKVFKSSIDTGEINVDLVLEAIAAIGEMSEEDVAAVTKAVGADKKASDFTAIKKDADGNYDLSAVPEEVRPMVAELWKANEEHAEAIKKANDRADAQEAVIKKERDERVLKEFVTKADGFKNLSVKADLFGSILKKAAEALTDDEYAELDRVLKSADDSITSLFKEHGHNLEGDDDSSAIAQLEKAAVVIAKRDGITKEAAFVKALDENPEMAAAERAERTH